jgi:hypothetical protein
MHRTLVVFSGVALVALAAQGCLNLIPLDPGYYPAVLDTGEVRIVDARGMERAQVETLLREHHLVARFDVRIPRSADFEQCLAEEVEKGKARALAAGGNTLMYTDDSQLIAIIKTDARYAGAANAITMYVMLPRG